MRDFDGRTVLITSGPTREYLDSIRFISNRSTGRMGTALGEAARDRGARVIFVTGPAEVAPPNGVEVVRVETAEEMLDRARPAAARADVVIGAAAVLDIRPRERATVKLHRSLLPPSLDLRPTPDVIASLAAGCRPGQVFVGFAAEDDRMVENAREKMRQKGLDLIVANLVSDGFGGETNEVVILGRDGFEARPPRGPKRAIADRVLDEAARLLAVGSPR